MPRSTEILTGKPEKTGFGQGRAPNTVKLRNEYTKARLEAETEGKPIEPFVEWAKKNYPDVKILE
jgi:hypothetical protein